MLSNWKICNLKFKFITFWNTSCFRNNCNVLVNLSLPDKIEIKFTIVLNNHFLCFSFIYEEISILKLMWFSRRHFLPLGSSKNRMMDFITFSFNIENKWSILSFDITYQIIVIMKLILWLKQNL